MKKSKIFFVGMMAMLLPATLSAQNLFIPTHSTSGVEIIKDGRFDKMYSNIGNTGGGTQVYLGEVDFGEDGAKYKAASVLHANNWNGRGGYAVLSFGESVETAVPFTAMEIGKTWASYNSYREFAAPMACLDSDSLALGTTDTIAVTKPTGVQKVYLTYVNHAGNIRGVKFYEDAIPAEHYEADGENAGIVLSLPNVWSENADKFVRIESVNSTPAVPTGEGTDYKDTRLDGDSWGWTSNGFVASYGNVDFTDAKQVVLFLGHWSGNVTDYLEVYIDDTTSANMVARVWVGQELRDRNNYPLATNLSQEISGSHELLVKWIGGSTNLSAVEVWKETQWDLNPDCGIVIVDDLPSENALHSTFEGQPENKTSQWEYEIINGGQYESAGNIGYTGNGTVLLFKDVDFGENAYNKIIVNHACDNNGNIWLGDIDVANFSFYADTVNSVEDWKDAAKRAEIIANSTPVAVVRMQSTASWGVRKHVAGDLSLVYDVQNLYMVYNTPGGGSNVFDIYLEPNPNPVIRPTEPEPAGPVSYVRPTLAIPATDLTIIKDGKFDKMYSNIGNTGGGTQVYVGEVDFGENGDKYKAASVLHANNWNGRGGYAVLSFGESVETALPFTAMEIGKTPNSYNSYREFAASMACLNADSLALGTSDTIAVAKPTGVQKVYLTYVNHAGNIRGIQFYEENIPDTLYAKDGDNAGIMLVQPDEFAGNADKYVRVESVNSTPAVPTGEGTDYKETRLNGDAWGWTSDGFVASYGNVDFTDAKQVVLFLNHWSGNITDYLEVYIDDTTSTNMVARVWVGQELRDGKYPLANNLLSEVSGTHELLVKWRGGSTDLSAVEIWKEAQWNLTPDCGIVLVDDKPSENAFHSTFEGQPENQTSKWAYEIINQGQRESNGNVGYTGNGTVLLFKDVDFGENAYNKIIVNHAAANGGNLWLGEVNEANFSFYADNVNSIEDWKDATKRAEIIANSTPVAVVRMQSTGDWGIRKHVAGDLSVVYDVQNLYMVYNTPGEGANVWDIYLEPNPNPIVRPEEPTEGTVSATWLTYDSETGTFPATASYSVEGIFTESSITVNSAVAKDNGVKKISAGTWSDVAEDVYFNGYGKGVDINKGDGTEIVRFNVTPASDKIFTPTKVSMKAIKDGFSDGAIRVILSTPSKSVTLVSNQALNRNNSDFTTYTSISLPVSDFVVEGEPVSVVITISTESKMGATKQDCFADVVLEGTYATAEPAKVAYLCGSTETPDEDIYNALVAGGLNVTPLNYDAVSLTDSIVAADFAANYDVVVLAGATGSGTALAATHNLLVGKVPVLSTKAFWYAKTSPAGTNGGNPGTAEAPSLAIVKDALNAEHTIFAGIEGDTIAVFNDMAKSTGRYLQSNGKFADNTPAQTTLATAGGQDCIGEAWVDGKGWVIIPVDGAQPAGYLTDAGKQLFLNAVNYLVAGEAYEIPFYGTCADPVINVTAVAEGSVEHVLTITCGEPAEGVSIYYTTDGSEPSAENGKLYDAAAPDTIVYDCVVKAVATAFKYHNSQVVSYEFTNANLVTLGTPVISTVANAEGGYVEISIAATTEGVDASAYQVRYTTDGSEPSLTNGIVYSAPFKFYGSSVTIKAASVGEGYNTSEIATQEVVNANYIAREKTLYYTDFNMTPSNWYYYDAESGLDSDPNLFADAAGLVDNPDTKPSANITVFAKQGAGGTVNWKGWTLSSIADSKAPRIMIYGQTVNETVGNPYGPATESDLGATSRCLYMTTESGGQVELTYNEAFAAPFDVDMFIGTCNVLNGKNFTVNMYVSDDKSTWELAGTISLPIDKMVHHVVLPYNGEGNKYIRLELPSSNPAKTNPALFDFKVKGQGYDPLEVVSVTPAGGAKKDEAVALADEVTEFVYTFNNELVDDASMIVYFGTGNPTETNCQYTIVGKTLTITRPAGTTEAATYTLAVRNAKDIAGQTVTKGQYYKIEAVSGIDNADADKEVAEEAIYSINGTPKAALTQGVNIVKVVYTDGTVEVKKVIVK